ncbi:MAG TPA: hypothetical protein VJL54_01065 [Nitrososphaera sp.]|nr:hypothetical protein [Nitrososphaera sp.]
MTQKVANRLVLAIAMAVVASASFGSFNQNSYANPVPSFVPGECEQYVDQPSTDHVLTVLTAGPFLPGDEIEVKAETTDTGTGTNRVRIVAILEGTTIHENLILLPNPSGSVTDSFNIPGDAKQGDELDVYACFESPGSLQGDGVTHHLNVGSFFVLPESPIGILALVGSSLAVLGGFMVLKKRSNGQLPL